MLNFNFSLSIVQVSWVRLRGPVIQANGRLKFEDDLKSGGLLCFIHSEPASALGSQTQGWLGVESCTSTLPAGYIPQRKTTSMSSSGSLGFIVCEVVDSG